MPIVRVSARILRWPPICACCLDPCDTYVSITATRVTGVRAIRADVRTWEVPYCHCCLEHTKITRALEEFRPQATNLTWLPVMLGSLFTVLLWFICIATRSALLGWGMLFLFGGLTSLTSIILCPALKVRYLAAKAEDARQHRNLKLNFESSYKPDRCIGYHAAAHYEGWEGSVHTFHFANSGFAAAFEEANGGKVIGRLN